MPIKTVNPILAAASAAGFRMSAQRRRLIDCAHKGEMFIGGAGRGRDRLDATFVRWLCATGEVAKYVHAHGLNVSEVEIVGELDLGSVNCGFPVTFQSCRLPQKCIVRLADLPLLRFMDCQLEGLEGDQVRVGRSMVFRGSTIRNGVLLRGANIGGNLSFVGARLEGGGEHALSLEGATIGGSLWMTEGFRADAPVRIYSAEIKKNIESDGVFVAPRVPTALLIEVCHIGGSVLLRRGFRCLGQVRIFGVNVQGSIDFQGARIAASGDFGLLLEASTVSRAILIRGDSLAPHDSFRCVGGISLSRTATDADVDFSHAEVRAKQRPAANFYGLRCEGQFQCRNSTLHGELILANAFIRNDTVLTDTVIDVSARPAIRATGHHCGGNLRLDRMVATGRVEFHNLFVGDNLFAPEGRFGDEQSGGAIFSSGRIRGAVEFPSATVMGRLVLDHCIIGAHLNLSDVSLTALDARQSVVGADVFLNNAKLGASGSKLPPVRLGGMRCQGWLNLGEGFSCRGTLDFSRSILGGLVANRARLRPTDGVAIEGSHVQVNGQFELAGSVIEGSVQLARATVSGSLDLSGSSVKTRRRYALDLAEARIGGTLYLARGFKVGRGAINLAYADVATLHDDPEHWPAPRALEIQGFTYRNIVPLERSSRIGWLHRWRPDDRTADDESSWQPYEQLMDTLRRHGREAGRKAVAIAKQRAIARSSRNWFSRWRQAIYGATMCYGYQPQRALLFAPFFIGFSIFVFMVGADSLMVPTNEPVRQEWAKHHTLPDGYPTFNAVAYSVDSFVPILSLQQRDTWRPDDRATCSRGPRNCGSLLRILLWFNVAVGWIVTTLVVAGFTGLIRRD